MKLILVRNVFTDIATLGDLYIDGHHFCYTLEDKDRDLVWNDPDLTLRKVHGQTCIPRGIYDVKITLSARFKRLMPQIMNVPAFEGIRIHTGNTDADVEGCILLGRIKGYNFIGESAKAYNEFFPILKERFDHESCTLEILKFDILRRSLS